MNTKINIFLAELRSFSAALPRRRHEDNPLRENGIAFRSPAMDTTELRVVGPRKDTATSLN